MINHSSRIDRLALVSVATLLLGTTLVPDANGWRQPPTPCPCAADGTCQPNGPWGHTPTKWRPWPGESLSQAPTTAEEDETREQLQLPPFELPPIVKEGLRGPNKARPPKSKREDQDAAEAAQDNALEPAAPMPAVDPLEGFDPGGIDVPDQFNLEPPVEQQLQPEAEPMPEFDLQDEPQPEQEEAEPAVEPLDDFDPFSQLDRRRIAPTPASRRTSLAPAAHDDAPPQLPPSLRKLSRRSAPARRAPLRDSRYRGPAVAMVQ